MALLVVAAHWWLFVCWWLCVGFVVSVIFVGWDYGGLTGKYSLVIEGELRAIARYGSTAGMSDGYS